MTAPRREIVIANRHPRLRLNRRAVAGAIHTLDAHAARFRGGCPAGELSVVFLSDAALAQLHGKFLDDPSPTDVITFTGDLAHGVAGEICLSVDAAVEQARKRRRSFTDEVLLYLVHGWLHLAGYDDRTPIKKRAMRRAEARALELLGRASCRSHFAFRNRL